MTSWILEHFKSFLFEENLTKDGQAFGFLPLIGPAFPVILIDAFYVLFVFKLGPKFMESRKPYDLKNVLKWYNTFQIVSNLYLSVMAMYNILAEEDIKLDCMLQLPIGHRRKLIEVHLFYWGYLNKFLDYFDTILFVMRKSYRQINFLHVYHHLMMTTCIYLYIRYYGFGGHSAIIGVLNCIVHVFMYSYYLITAIRPDLRKSIWWKRYITKLQLVQFCLMFITQVWPLIFKPDCKFPKVWLYLTMIQSSLMLIMFGDFYRRTYFNVKNNKNINNNNNNNNTKPMIDLIGMCNRNLSEDLNKYQKTD